MQVKDLLPGNIFRIPTVERPDVLYKLLFLGKGAGYYVGLVGGDKINLIALTLDVIVVKIDNITWTDLRETV